MRSFGACGGSLCLLVDLSYLAVVDVGQVQRVAVELDTTGLLPLHEEGVLLPCVMPSVSTRLIAHTRFQLLNSIFFLLPSDISFPTARNFYGRIDVRVISQIRSEETFSN